MKKIIIKDYEYTIHPYGENNITVKYIGNAKHITELPLFHVEGKIINSFKNLYSGSKTIESVDLSTYGFDGIKNIDEMFAGCTNLKSVNLGNLFDDLESCNKLFYNCTSLEIMGGIGDKSPIKSCESMFENCKSLKEIRLSFIINGNASYMFKGCENLKDVNLGAYHTLKDTKDLFVDCLSVEHLEMYCIKFENCEKNRLIYNCPSLKSVLLSKQNENVINTITHNTPNVSIYVGGNCIIAGNNSQSNDTNNYILKN